MRLNYADKYYGKTIKSAAMDDDRFKVSFEDGVEIEIWDNGQSCCESRYMRTDDNPADLVGGVLTEIKTKPGPDSIDEHGYEHKIVFLEILTDKGSIVFSNHNEHNGYYGGFELTITEKAAWH